MTQAILVQLQVLYPREMNIYVHKNVYKNIIADLFIRDPYWNNPNVHQKENEEMH